ncbi:MAG TPA: hypothetical protein VLM79_21290, partial [Kofleriaceae bacterium]|nr:hypothetical protein [Kofleriaceae bacterium]
MFIDPTRVGVEQRPYEFEHRLRKLSPCTDRAVELEVRERLPELIEAELAAQTGRLATFDGMARVAVLQLLQEDVDSAASVRICHGLSRCLSSELRQRRVEPLAKHVKAGLRDRFERLPVDRDALAAERRRQFLARALLPRREVAEHASQAAGQG